MMVTELRIYNPSNYPRSGYATIPWQEVIEKTEIAAEEIALRSDLTETPVAVQVDDLDPSDPSLKTLVLKLEEEVAPGPEDYSLPSLSLHLESGGIEQDPLPAQEVDRENDRVSVIALNNGRLRIAFSLIPQPAPDLGSWYSGSAPVVQLNGDEMLDLFRAPFPQLHDPEKRCMQIDRLRLSNPAWEGSTHQEVMLFEQPYDLISQNVGPVRSTITVASGPFEYVYTDPHSMKRRVLNCRLYRVISLYANADYIIEELFVKARPTGDDYDLRLNFEARYFCYIDFGFIPEIYRFENIPDWFALGQPRGSVHEPHPGYGFATDVHTGPIAHPHPGFHDADASYKSFSWELMPGQQARCLHLFMHGEPAGFDSRIGHCWYEHIYKPLRAQVY